MVHDQFIDPVVYTPVKGINEETPENSTFSGLPKNIEEIVLPDFPYDGFLK